VKEMEEKKMVLNRKVRELFASFHIPFAVNI